MKIRDFLRVAKGGITSLVVLVAITGFLSNPLALKHLILLIPLIIAGSMASFSASILNNVYDRDIDGRMQRTRYRGDIITAENRAGWISIAIVLIAGSSLLSYITINLLSTIFIFLGFASYIGLYTILLKRRTTWNIVIGGIAGSFPALAGWAAVSNNVSYTALFIAFLVFMWTPTHFWSLASYKADDYSTASVPMLPSVVGIRIGFRWIVANTAILIAYTLLPIFFAEIHVGIVYFAMALVMDAYLIYTMFRISMSSYKPAEFKKAFIFSNFYLLILLVSVWFVIL